jgi:hypothetical protein
MGSERATSFEFSDHVAYYDTDADGGLVIAVYDGEAAAVHVTVSRESIPALIAELQSVLV